MKELIKKFCLRGLLFSVGGPLIYGIVMFIIGLTMPDLVITPKELLIGIVSISILSFLVAGASCLYDKERNIAISTLIHLTILYVSYILCYLINGWLEFDIKVILIFTLIFIGGYFIIWLSIYIPIKINEKKLNQKLNRK